MIASKTVKSREMTKLRKEERKCGHLDTYTNGKKSNMILPLSEKDFEIWFTIL